VVERSARLEVLARGLDVACEGLRQALEEAGPRFESGFLEFATQRVCLGQENPCRFGMPMVVASCPAEICASTR
jgi:hypothetical protein